MFTQSHQNCRCQMRRNLTEAERVQALYWFYMGGKNIKEIATALSCSLYDLSPWITQVAARIVLGIDKQNPELAFKADLIQSLDKAATAIVSQSPEHSKLFERAANALRHAAMDHEIDRNLIHIADIQRRETRDALEKIVNAQVYTTVGDTTSGISLELVGAIVDAAALLKNEADINVNDDTYTECVAGDGAAILKDGVPLTINQILDILNGRTAR